MSAMKLLLDDVSKSLDAELWVTAIYGALAVPDICGAMESTDGRATGARYKDWFRRYLSPKYPRLDPDECYQLRCSMLHQGRTATKLYPAIVFTVPTGDSGGLHNNFLDDKLNLDIARFVNDIILAYEAWWDDRHAEPHIIANAARALQWSTYFHPAIGAWPVLS